MLKCSRGSDREKQLGTSVALDYLQRKKGLTYVRKVLEPEPFFWDCRARNQPLMIRVESDEFCGGRVR